MERKIEEINEYYERIGSPIRYMFINANFYRNNDVESGDDFDEVSLKHVNQVYDIIKNLK